jgi:sarcosine oxidase
MYDLIVIGAGAIGSATAYHAAKAGNKVLLLEQYAIDHQRGSSYGYSRIIRYAYDHAVYVELAKAAYPAWRAFEQDSGETIYTRTGGLDLAPPGEPLFEAMVKCLSEADVPHFVLDAAESRELYPQFQPDSDMKILYQPDAGVLRASKSVRAHVRLAQQYGADVRDSSPVVKITPLVDGVEVETTSGTFSAARLVLAPGAWLNHLLQPLGLKLPLQPIAPQENYFNALEPDQFKSERFPVWIAHVQSSFGQILYGLPDIDGSGVKIGLHSGPPIDPENPSREPDAQTSAAMFTWAQQYIPQAAGTLATSRVCLYTLTPDEHFVIDRHPQHPQIIITSCCSGHAFKFSTLLGAMLSNYAFTGQTQHDISSFTLSRFGKIEV